MLATPADEPFHRAGWVYEEWYDGERLIAYKDGARLSLVRPDGERPALTYDPIAIALAHLPARTLILDGAAVAFDSRLRSSRVLLRSEGAPVLFAVFDCLHVNGRDLRREPLRDRRRAVTALVRDSDRLFAARRLAPNGVRAFDLACRKGLAGLIAKDGLSAYEAGPSLAWRSLHARATDAA